MIQERGGPGKVHRKDALGAGVPSKERKKRIQEAKVRSSLVDCHLNLEQEGWSEIVEGQ